jgi:CcmD family protein
MVENELEFLFAGFAVFWAGLFVYLVILQARLRELQREIDQLEERLAESAGESTNATAAAGMRAPSTAEGERAADAEGSAPASEAGTGA